MQIPPTDRQHLSHDAALMLLAVLPDHIRDAYLNHAKQIDYSIEMVLEMALADFLDPDSLTFAENLGLKPRPSRATFLVDFSKNTMYNIRQVLQHT